MTWMPFVLLAVMVAICALAGRRVDAARIPMQWDFKGRPVWYAPRLVGLWFPVALAVFLLVFTWAAGDEEAPGWIAAAAAFLALAIQILYFVLLNRWQSRVN